MQHLVIRKALTKDSDEISQLISRNAKLLLNDDFDGDGLDFFLNTVSRQSITEYMDQGFMYLVAETASEIVGVVAIKDHRHLFHLFVDINHHNKGIAKKLWLDIFADSLQKRNGGVFTLNSTSYALAVYEHWGFVKTDDMQMRQGIRYTPMELAVDGLVMQVQDSNYRNNR
mgnify:CR=1 FL=1